MADLFDPLTAFLVGLSVLAVILFARSVYRFKRESRRMQKKLQEKTAELEFQAQSLKSDFGELSDANKNKIDLEYLNKRIDALISLINRQ